MMENKYYTPSIEEFHVGFEFEHKPLLVSIKEDRGGWTKAVFEIPYMSYLDLKYTRVKYLDREDIESLGFEYQGLFNLKEYRYSNGKYLLTYFNTKSSIWIESEGDTFFIGYIKNKSELKVLLKQIVI